MFNDEIINEKDYSTKQEFIEAVWQCFKKQFPDEDACLEKIESILHPNGLSECNSCGSQNLKRTRRRRVLKCSNCNHLCWITAGSFFNRIKKLYAWWAAIWFIERGIIISSSSFHRLLGVTQSTAREIFLRLTDVIEPYLNSETNISTPSVNFSSIVCKRSRETPANKHPQTEFETIKETSDSEFTSSSRIDFDPDLDQVSWLVFNAIDKKAIHFDDLAELTKLPASKISSILTILEIQGRIKALDGNLFVNNTAITNRDNLCHLNHLNITSLDSRQPDKNCLLQPSSLNSEDTNPSYKTDVASKKSYRKDTISIMPVIDFVKETFHGISKRYLQKYIAIFWCQIDRRRWNKGSLLSACIESQGILHHQNCNYTSPSIVKLPPDL